MQVDVQGLDLVIRSQPDADVASTSNSGMAKSKSRGKLKSKSEGTEILLNADLRLKAGVHYGLVGRNGAGKSSTARE